jgi:hypothetical protein
MQSTGNELCATSKVASKWQARFWRESDAERPAAPYAIISSMGMMVRSPFQKAAKTDERAFFVFKVMVERRLDVCMAAQSGKALSFELT